MKKKPLSIKKYFPTTKAEIITADSKVTISDAEILTEKLGHPAMKTTQDLLARYGNPVNNQKLFETKWMITWVVPDDIHIIIPHLPAHIYLNRDIAVSFEKILRKLIAANVHTEIRTWDGCFNVRSQVGSTTISRHSWGIALDMNAAWNKLYGKVSWSDTFLNICRNEPGWILGADFYSRKDGMHFEHTAFNAF